MGTVSILVCTRNRAEQVVEAVRLLLDDDAPDLELIVVDQSDGSESEEALSRCVDDPRLRYLHSKGCGKGAALNEGLRIASGSILVCTDDDCRAPRGWASSMAHALDEWPSAAIVFCRVVPGPHDPSAGYVPAFEAREGRVLRSIADMRNGTGLGAGMALRRDFVLGLGGFDDSFGPGARFPAADDWDLCFRALLNGWQVRETSVVSIVHDGFRTFAEGRSHARRDWLALGAVCAKPLRAGYLRAAIVPMWFAPTRALWPPISDLLHLRRPRGLGRVSAFLVGFLSGLTTSVDSATLRFDSDVSDYRPAGRRSGPI